MNLISSLLLSFGYLAVFLAGLVESGILIGVFLPGDTIIITASALAASGKFSIEIIVGLVFLGVVIGDSLGYWLGRIFGLRFTSQDASRFVSKEKISQAAGLYEKYGGWALFFGRFIPFVRVLFPATAAISGMSYRRFLLYNLPACALWSVVVCTVGFLAGRILPSNMHYLILLVFVVVLGINLPQIIKIVRDPQNRSHTKEASQKARQLIRAKINKNKPKPPPNVPDI